MRTVICVLKINTSVEVSNGHGIHW